MRHALPLRLILGGLGLTALVSATAAAEPHEEPMRRFAEETVKAWIGDSVVVSSIRAQNTKHAGIDQTRIDQLDRQWRAEVAAPSRPMIDEILANELSRFLAQAHGSAGGLVTEIFVMDNRGLNVGQSDVTSDYWQGDEAKWRKTFLAGPDIVFIDEIEKDESTQTFQSQVSLSVTDPASGEVIGAITVGVNVDIFLQ